METSRLAREDIFKEVIKVPNSNALNEINTINSVGIINIINSITIINIINIINYKLINYVSLMIQNYDFSRITGNGYITISFRCP